MSLSLTLALAASAGAIAQTGAAQGEQARLGTFAQDGENYFALSLMPQVAADPAQKNEVVIVVDTSASQAGRYRTEAINSLQALLGSLAPDDHVALVAVDVQAAPMTAGLVAPNSAEMQAALAKLNGRTPLGATDLEAGLRAATKYFTAAGAARSVVYIGDAMSKAAPFTEASLRTLVGDLRAERVSVSSYVVGLERNVQLMAALANHTGGLVEVHGDAPDNAANSGRALAGAVNGGVVWPQDVTLSANVAASYPANMPPLRTDRDSILIGKLSQVADVSVNVAGTLNGKPVKLAWQATPEKPNPDFAFLPKLVDMASADKGLSLPTVGSPGLREAALVTLASAQQLTRLGHEALASGNFAGAKQVAAAALARDPGNPEARAIQSAAQRVQATGRVPAASEPDLKLTGFQEPPPGNSLLAEVLAEPPGFIDQVESERQLMAARMRKQVESDLNEARKLTATDPAQAENNLKLTLEEIERASELDPAVRSQLRQQIENAIRFARNERIVFDDRVAAAQEKKAQAEELIRLNDRMVMEREKIKQIVDRFDSLMDEGRYRVADDEISPEIDRLAPDSTIAASVVHGGRLRRNVNEINATWLAKEKGWLQTLYQVEVSMIPFPDEPPIVYMAADQWQDLTLRRQKYKAVDLGRPGGAESRILSELNKETAIDFQEQSLKDAIDYLKDQHNNLPIVINTKKLDEAGVSIDTPITKTLAGISLRSALRLILSELELTYVIRDEVLLITTPEDAESQLITKVYPVGDLVIPIGANSSLFGLGGGGMMGGMGGGMMGGMGGGMGGGMMGGMGGMGGGMGGMGGGMGGMFAVEDDLKLGAKKVEPAVPAAAPAAVQEKEPEPAVAPAVRRPAAASKPAARIQLTLAAGQQPAAAWDRYFAEQASRLSSLPEAEAASAELLASVRETVRELMHEKKYGEVATLIQAALRNGHVESWMYEAMSLALRADNATNEDLERALLSAVDFASTEDQVVMAAAYMAQAGLPTRALKLYQQIGNANPSRPEPFIQGLALARELNDASAIQWACVGLLAHAWTGEHKVIGEEALRVARSTYEQLQAAGKKSEAEAFLAAVRKAQERDCVVMVTWTGEADIDISVEEPSGTVVSQREPRSTSGGVHLGDVSSADSKAQAKGYAEGYVCPEGFSGKYRLLIKNIWGRPTSGKVTVDVYTHYGTDKQQVQHGLFPVGDKLTAVEFEIDGGRRQDALPEAQVVQVARIQNAANRTVLAQQLVNQGNAAAGNLAAALALSGELGLGPGFFRRGAVGYRPQLTVLPEGANFSTNAVISADRRYVRMSPSPTFSQVTEVSTFNFVTGSGSTQQQGGGGGFGGGIGGGGGLF